MYILDDFEYKLDMDAYTNATKNTKRKRTPGLKTGPERTTWCFSTARLTCLSSSRISQARPKLKVSKT